MRDRDDQEEPEKANDVEESEMPMQEHGVETTTAKVRQPEKIAGGGAAIQIVTKKTACARGNLKKKGSENAILRHRTER